VPSLIDRRRRVCYRECPCLYPCPVLVRGLVVRLKEAKDHEDEGRIQKMMVDDPFAGSAAAIYGHGRATLVLVRAPSRGPHVLAPALCPFHVYVSGHREVYPPAR